MHSNNAGDSIDSLNQKKTRFHSSGTSNTLGFGFNQKPLFEASYKVAYLIAKNKKSHAIGETLVKPCALEMVEAVLGKSQRNQIVAVPLSNDVIRSRKCHLIFWIIFCQN